MLDKQKPYGTVSNAGDHSIRHYYEQGGKVYNAQGYELDKDGNQIEFPKNQNPVVVDDEKELLPPAPDPAPEITMGVEPEPKPEKAKMLTYEIDGELVVVDTNLNNYVSKSEIKEALRNLGVKYLVRDTREQLLERLTDKISEIESDNER